MAKKKSVETEGPVPGTVEYERLRHFEREKAAYEERTGEKVGYELDAPLTSTLIIKQEPAEAVEPADDEISPSTEGEA